MSLPAQTLLLCLVSTDRQRDAALDFQQTLTLLTLTQRELHSCRSVRMTEQHQASPGWAAPVHSWVVASCDASCQTGAFGAAEVALMGGMWGITNTLG